MKHSWTHDDDAKLIRCVERAIRCGFHKTDSPAQREDGLGKRVAFWDAVAILMNVGFDGPSPRACASRFPIALDYWTDPANVCKYKDEAGINYFSTEDGRAVVREGVSEDLKYLDDAWAETTVMMDANLTDRLDEIAACVAELQVDVNRIKTLADYDPQTESEVKR